MALLSVKDVSIGFGGFPLLDNVNLQVEAHEKVCLLGRNGSGKTTLMRLINGDIEPDSGEITRRQGICTARLDQEIPHDLCGPVSEVIFGGLGNRIKVVGEEEWEIQRKIKTVMTRMKLVPDADFEILSAGLKRRTVLARALVSEPDILMLDEPTNHMDIGSIALMEEFLASYRGTVIIVTHDRVLVQKLATRIVEIDRGSLLDWRCNYRDFLKRKDESMNAEAKGEREFDRKLSKEEAWIRQGIKARRTRDQGRVKTLLKMREERRKRRDQMGTVKMKIAEARRSGNLVLEAEGLHFNFDDKSLINPLDVTIMRGDRVGIIGPNGCGKTTLIHLLLGKLKANGGRLRHGTNLEVTYFDQLRDQLDEEATVMDAVAEGNDRVVINGQTRHVIGYLQDFLFTPFRSKTRVKVLSGGERCRLMLAKLFTRPANVLVLDEPTNDLDIETLELLEEILMEFRGTLLLVSHDRAFLNNVVTSTLVFEGEGNVNEYIGGYDDWLTQRRMPTAEMKEKPVKKTISKPKKKSLKLSYKEKQELESIPQKIEDLETEKEKLYQAMGDPKFYKGDSDIAGTQERLKTVEIELEEAYKRWEFLEERKIQAERRFVGGAGKKGAVLGKAK